MTETLPPHLQELDTRLNALSSATGGIRLSEVDGYLTAIILCPDPIAPEDWLPWVLSDGDEEDEPDKPVLDFEELKELLTLIMEHYQALSRAFEGDGQDYAPIYDYSQVFDTQVWEFWLDGFNRGMQESPDSWVELLETGDEVTVTALTLLFGLIAINRGESDLGAELSEALIEELTENASVMIPGLVWQLNIWRREHASGALPRATEPVLRAGPKVGRNAPCPCGSGRKYKKCCGRLCRGACRRTAMIRAGATRTPPTARAAPRPAAAARVRCGRPCTWSRQRADASPP